MKIGNVEITGPHEELLVLPHGDQEIVIRAKAVLDMDTFDKLCPEPKPPGKRTREGWIPNPDDTNYKTILDQYQNRRLGYMIIKSLEPSNIEWPTVNINDPHTWANYVLDMRAGGLSNIEINRIISCVMQANALDEKKLEEARRHFLLGQQMESDQSSGLNTEQVGMPSGQPVSG